MVRTFIDLERAIGYSFRNRRLVEQALTHRSFVNEQPGPGDNERLEFLGDAVLSLIVSDLLFERLPQLDEGRLSRRRASLVSASSLVRHARAIDLGAYLVLGKGEEKTGGRQKPRLLVGAFEALVGAIFLDSGLDRVRTFLLRFLAGEISAEGTRADADFKSLLQERVQAEGTGGVVYRVVGETGPDHRKLFSVEVLVAGRALSTGTGSTKKIAEQAAARRALDLVSGLETLPEST